MLTTLLLLAGSTTACAAAARDDDAGTEAGAANADDSRVAAPIGRSPVRGPSGAAVTIVEFADYSCGVCQQAEGVMKELLAKYPRDVRVVFKFLPLTNIHPDAEAQAIGADCAAAQGKFAAFHEAAMLGGVPAGSLARLAKSVGADLPRWQACVKKGGSGRIREDGALAARLGVAGTPTFVINGQLLEGYRPLEEMRRIVDAEIQRVQKERLLKN